MMVPQNSSALMKENRSFRGKPPIFDRAQFIKALNRSNIDFPLRAHLCLSNRLIWYKYHGYNVHLLKLQLLFDEIIISISFIFNHSEIMLFFPLSFPLRLMVLILDCYSEI